MLFFLEADAAASCAAACCGGITAAAMRGTLPPPLLGCRRYSYAVLFLLFRAPFLIYFAFFARTSTLLPSILEASPADFCYF